MKRVATEETIKYFQEERRQAQLRRNFALKNANEEREREANMLEELRVLQQQQDRTCSEP